MELLPHELAAAAAGPRPAPGFLHVPAWHTRLVAAGVMRQRPRLRQNFDLGIAGGPGAATRRPALLGGRIASSMPQDKRPAAIPYRSWFLGAPGGDGKRRDSAAPFPCSPGSRPGRNGRGYRLQPRAPPFSPPHAPCLVRDHLAAAAAAAADSTVLLYPWMLHAKPGREASWTPRSRGAYPACGAFRARAERPLRAWRAPWRTCEAPAYPPRTPSKMPGDHGPPAAADRPGFSHCHAKCRSLPARPCSGRLDDTCTMERQNSVKIGAKRMSCGQAARKKLEMAQACGRSAGDGCVMRAPPPRIRAQVPPAPFK